MISLIKNEIETNSYDGFVLECFDLSITPLFNDFKNLDVTFVTVPFRSRI